MSAVARRTHWLLSLTVSALALAVPAAAQGVPQQGPPPQQQAANDPLARVREMYQPEAWPQPGPRLRGLAWGQLELARWERRTAELDPARAEVVLTFAPRQGAEPAALVRLSLHADPAAARLALQKRLGAVQTKLGPEAGALDVAFAGREASGKLRLLVGVRGDALLVVQRIGPGGALEELARAAEQVLLAAPTLAAREARPAPRLQLARLLPAEDPEQGLPLQLDLDPGAPAPAELAFEGPPGVSVVRLTDGSFRVYGAQPGALDLVAHACSTELQAADLTLKLTVPAR